VAVLLAAASVGASLRAGGRERPRASSGP